ESAGQYDQCLGAQLAGEHHADQSQGLQGDHEAGIGAGFHRDDRHGVESTGTGGEKHGQEILGEQPAQGPGQGGAQEDEEQVGSDDGGYQPDYLQHRCAVEAQADITADGAIGQGQNAAGQGDVQPANQVQGAADDNWGQQGASGQEVGAQ